MSLLLGSAGPAQSGRRSASARRAVLRGIAAIFTSATLVLAEEAPSIDKLVEQLSARDLTTRRDAAYQLGKLGTAAKPALPALIKAVSDPDKQVWSLSLGALANLGPDAAEALPALIENLDSRRNRGGRERDRRQLLMRSAFVISRIGPVAIPRLIEALKSGDAVTRAGSARALGSMGPAANAAIPVLVANLPHGDADERRETIDALGLIGRDAAPALGEALGSSDASVRAGAALALAQIGQEAKGVASKVADAAAKEGNPAARAALLSAVGKTGVEPARAAELLVAGVKDDNEEVRHGAINAVFLLRSASDRLVPALTMLLRDANPVLSERAAAVLGRLGPAAHASVPALLEVARRRSPMPQACLDALGQMGPSVVPVVLKAIAGENPDALTPGHWSVKCLEKIGGESVTPLAAALGDASAGVRLVAARALGQLGPAAAPAMNALLGAAGDDDPRVRAAILTALVATRTRMLAAASRIESALKDSSPVVRTAAAKLVPELGDHARALAPALLAALGDADAGVRAAVVESLSSVGAAAEPAIDGLLKILPGANAETRARVLAVFAGIGASAKAALPAVQESLKDKDPGVRAAAVTAFGKIAESKERLPVLLAALDDSAKPVRQAGAAQVAALGDKAREATGKLTPLLQREDERDFAFDALKQISPKSVPDLIAMLGDRDLAVKSFACRRLASLGPEARDAIPTLEAILQSREREELKRVVVETLKRIKPNP